VSYRLIVRPKAEADMVEAFDWYEERRPGLGHEFLGTIRSVLQAIADHPLRHSVIYREVRRALPRRFPYKVLYFVQSDEVQIIGVIHVRRHPLAWPRRV
jgi:plasmid stabilization system protein ParE